MIGLRTSNSKYLKIYDGYICDYKNQNLGNFVGGYIKDIQFKNVQSDTSTIEILELTLSWEQESYILNLPTDTTGRGFMLCFPNIDITKPIDLNCAKNKAGYSYIWILQDGKSVPNLWTKENPGDKPDWTVTPSGKYDKKQELAYLKNYTAKFFELQKKNIS